MMSDFSKCPRLLYQSWFFCFVMTVTGIKKYYQHLRAKWCATCRASPERLLYTISVHIACYTLWPKYFYVSILVSSCLSICLSVCRSVTLSLCLFVHLSISLSVWLAVCLCVDFCFCLFMCVCACVCICVCVCACVCVRARVCVCVYCDPGWGVCHGLVTIILIPWHTHVHIKPILFCSSKVSGPFHTWTVSANFLEGGVGCFSNKRGFSVESSLQRISSNFCCGNGSLKGFFGRTL